MLYNIVKQVFVPRSYARLCNVGRPLNMSVPPSHTITKSLSPVLLHITQVHVGHSMEPAPPFKKNALLLVIYNVSP